MTDIFIEAATVLALDQSPGQGRTVEFELASDFACDTLEDVLGVIANELYAFAESVGDFHFALASAAEV